MNRRVHLFDAQSSSKTNQALALCVGNFDGVHRGHQALLRRLRQSAKARQLSPVALTFSPNPKSILCPNEPFFPLYPLSYRIESLLAFCDHVYVAHFTDSFRAQSAEVFLTHCAKLGVRFLLLGKGSRLGAKTAHFKTSDPTDRNEDSFSHLCQIGKHLGIEIQRENLQQNQHEPISSSRIRSYLKNHDLVGAQRLLGRAYGFRARVMHGKKLGRTLGFRTMNLHLPHNTPIDGVYAAFFWSSSGGEPILSAAHARNANDHLKLELHVLDVDLGDLYTQRIGISLHQRVRDHQRFDDLKALQDAISCDVQRIQKFAIATKACDNPYAISWMQHED